MEYILTIVATLLYSVMGLGVAKMLADLKDEKYIDVFVYLFWPLFLLLTSAIK